LKFFSENQVNVNNYLSILFCDFPLIAQSGKSHVTTRLIRYAPHIQSVVYWYWRTWDLLAFEYVQTSVDKNVSKN